MALYKKLLEIQQEVDSFVKDAVGANGNYKFASGNKVLGKIRPLMNDKGLLLKQETLDLENTRIDYSTKNGPRSEILSKVKIKFTWIDVATGEKDENFFFANGMNGWDKGLGSALTYAERYFLLKYFHVPTDEDDIDNKKDEEQGGTSKNEKKFNRDNVIAWLDDKYENCDRDTKTYLKEKLKFLKKSTFSFCKNNELEEIIKELKERKETKEPDIKTMLEYIETNHEQHQNSIDDTLERTGEPFLKTLDNEEIKTLYNLMKGTEN